MDAAVAATTKTLPPRTCSSVSATVHGEDKDSGSHLKELAPAGAPQAAICSSAVGALQNVSREVQSCAQILELGGVEPLSDLLFATDVQAQVAAAGALLNIYGHPAEDEAAPTTDVALADINAPARQAMLLIR